MHRNRRKRERERTKRTKSFTATACKVPPTLPTKPLAMEPILLHPLASSQSKLSLLSFPMAKTISSSNHNLKALHAWRLLGLLLVLVRRGGAFEFKVGSSGDWKLPTDPNVFGYNLWAEKNRFQIGDTLRKLSHFTFIYHPNCK